MKKLMLLAMMIGLLISGCATIPTKTYEETVSEWNGGNSFGLPPYLYFLDGILVMIQD